MAEVSLTKLPSDECHKTLPVTDDNMVPTDLEKCLNLNAVLKSAWFFDLPWKWEIFLEKCLEITLWSWKIKSIRNLICWCGFFFCTFDLKKVMGFSNFVIKSPSLLMQWAVFFTVQITKSILCVITMPQCLKNVILFVKSPWISFLEKCGNHVISQHWFR